MFVISLNYVARPFVKEKLLVIREFYLSICLAITTVINAECDCQLHPPSYQSVSV